MAKTTKGRLGFTKVSNRLLDHLLEEPCLCCEGIYEEKIRKLKKKIIVAQRMATLLQLLKLSYGVGTRKSIDSVLKEWAEANG